MTEQRPVGPEDGFTLVELLVALALLALLTAFLSDAMYGSRILLQRVDEAVEADSIVAVEDYFIRVIAGAQTLRLPPDHPAAGRMLAGDQDRLTFVTAYTPRGQYGGLYVTTLTRTEASTAAAGGRLEVEQIVYRPVSTPLAAASRRRETLVTGVKSFRLRYFGATRHDEPKRWRTTWDGAQALPRLIELTIEREGGSSRAPLIIELPLAQ